MDWTKMIFGGAAIGGLVAFWNQAKAMVWKFCNFFVQRVNINTVELANGVISHLVKNYPYSQLYDRLYEQSPERIKKMGLSQYVVFERLGANSMIFRHKWMPFILSFPIDKNNNNSNSPQCSITYIRGTLDIDAIIRAGADMQNQLMNDIGTKHKGKTDRFFIRYIPDRTPEANQKVSESRITWWFHLARYRLLNFNVEDLGFSSPNGEAALGHLFFPPRITQLIEEIKLWRECREWYVERGIPWKRGWLLHGKPGCVLAETKIKVRKKSDEGKHIVFQSGTVVFTDKYE